MNKLKKFFIFLFLLINISPIKATTINTSIEDKINYVESYFLSRRGLDLNVSNYEILYDIEGNPTYILFSFEENSYAIFTKDNMVLSEYIEGIETPYNNNNKLHMYAGPFNYFDFELTRTINISNDTLINANTQMLGIEESPYSISTVAAIGIDTARFFRYSGLQWANSNDNFPNVSDEDFGNGLCGTVASAVMLAYIDDYIDDSLIPNSVRTRGSSSPGQLFNVLYNYVDYGHNGTITIDLVTGIEQFMSNYSVEKTWGASSGLAPWSYAVSNINQGRPVVIGLSNALSANKYGNHWITVYQYEDTSSADYFTAHTNWPDGSPSEATQVEYKAVINVTWSNSVVYVS